ncbi:MAG: carbohydrate ABC transporter permease [Candidatus Rokuibacteriota bacterium]
MTAGRRRMGVGRALALYGATALFLVFTLFPVYWLVNSSLKGSGELFSFPPRYWPREASVANYVDAMTRTRLGTLYLNSLWVSALTCGALMGLIVFAGYAMARARFRGKSWVIGLFLLAQVLPHVVLLLPFFTMFKAVGLINTRWALVVAYTVMTLPFSVLTMRGFFASIPVELDEAAMVDGCGRAGALFRVVLPAALPGLVATAIYGFINAWNELILAVILISSPSLQTLPVGLSSMIDENRTEYGMLMAIAVLSLIPSLAFFAWIQRYLTTGLSAGAVKA